MAFTVLERGLRTGRFAGVADCLGDDWGGDDDVGVFMLEDGWETEGCEDG